MAMANDLLDVPFSCLLTPKLAIHSTPFTILDGISSSTSTATKLKIHCSFSSTTIEHAEENRKFANYQPDMWNYDRLQSLSSHQRVEGYKERAKRLEERVRNMMKSKEDEDESLQMLELVDDIQRLGLGYRFEGEIRRALDQQYYNHIINDHDDNANNRSLHATALCFRLLRQHGYHISPDVFSSFKDQDGNFKANLSEDIKGMLSLYEASYLGMEGENVLDQAKEFTTFHLKQYPKTINMTKTLLAQQVNHALELPLHRRMQRLKARWTVEFYNKRPDANRVILELAALDFNLVQSEHQTELRDMSRWWMEMGLSNKLSFARDRLMECFFWCLGIVSEPQFSYCRKSLTKIAKLVTVIDDVYDVYGTMDELELFTDAVERWDVNLLNDLPDYMKLCFFALYNSVNEMAYDVLKEQGQVVLPYLTKAWADLLKTFLQEARWAKNKQQAPTFEEYIENGWMSVSGHLQLVYAYFLLGQNITKEELESLENYLHLLRWPSFVFRLCNDLATSEREIERGDTSGIVYYMRETGMSEESARKHMNSLIEEAWKEMNKLKHGNGIHVSGFGKVFIETAFNVARQAHCHYQYGDGHGAPDKRAEDRVASLLIEPIQL